MLKLLRLPISRCISLTEEITKKLTLIRDTKAYEHFLNGLSQKLRCPITLSYVNAHAFNLMQLNAAFHHELLNSDILLRDGIGLSILLRLHKINPGINMNGTDFNPKIIDQFLGKKVALCGTSDERLAAAKETLLEQGHNVVLTINGYQSDGTYLQVIEAAKPDLIVLGMGMPKQEHVADYLKQQLDYPCLILNTGAAIDYISGSVPRAPAWVRMLRTEWLYRMLVEPKRLWKRYILGNPVFLIRAFCAALFRKQ